MIFCGPERSHYNGGFTVFNPDRMGRINAERLVLIWHVVGFEPWLYKTNDLHIDTYRCLAWHLA